MIRFSSLLLILLSSGSTSAFANPFDDPRFEFLGDMLIYHGGRPIQGPQTLGAVKADVEPWEDGIIPLVFADSIPPENRQMLFSACEEWGKVAHVKCVEGPYKNRQLDVSDNESWGCFSLWGMGTYFGILKRMMNLASGCWRTPILLHELGHAFGLIHEHQRPDRDDYVSIIGENIQSGFLWLQQKVNFDPQDAILKTPYDFTSIMHYRKDAFSKNGEDTIVPKQGFEKFADIMGNVLTYSDGDAATLAFLYGGPGIKIKGGQILGEFRNTYYYSVREIDYPLTPLDAAIVNAEDQIIAQVNQAFLKALDIEGTGKLRGGRVVNFATRKEDGIRYRISSSPYGEGVGSCALSPFRSIAVDPREIPLGSLIQIEETIGMKLPDGSIHDGLWSAVDIGSAIQKDRIDLFVGEGDHGKVLEAAGISNLQPLTVRLISLPDDKSCIHRPLP